MVSAEGNCVFLAITLGLVIWVLLGGSNVSASIDCKSLGCISGGTLSLTFVGDGDTISLSFKRRLFSSVRVESRSVADSSVAGMLLMGAVDVSISDGVMQAIPPKE